MTVRCGNRLKLWNTMPTSRRTASMFFHPVGQFDRRRRRSDRRLVFLQPVDAADHGRFARAGRAADHDALASVDREVDVFESLEAAEEFGDLFQDDDRLFGVVVHVRLLFSHSGSYAVRAGRTLFG